jgi:dolichyl-phosphate beta-glucosyltransferase
VVIPAYNEEERLGETLEKVRAHLEGQERSFEIIVVDDGSADRTSEIAVEMLQGCEHRVLRNEPNAGKGASIKRGMLGSRGLHALFTDADLSTPIEEIDKLWKAIEGGADIAIGSRAVAGSVLAVRQPFHREMMGRTFNLIVRALVLPGFKDTQCGFKLFSRHAIESIFPLQSRDGFSFDVELLALGRAMGYRIAEVGVVWENSPASRVSPIRDSAEMFMDLLRLRRRMRSLRRDGSLAAVGRREAVE